MEYGQIAGNTSIDALIHQCFEFISEKDQTAFVKRFNNLRDDEAQCMHTFRELIVGGFLGARGLSVVYEQPLGGRTPDWSIHDSNGTQCIVELANFHVDKATEDKIGRHLQARRIWVGWTGSRSDRLYAQIWDKASKYKRLVEQEGVAYVIALYGEFTAAVDLEDVRECLFDKEKGLFSLYPEVSGLLFFVLVHSKRYDFTYIRNPDGAREVDLPCGVFPGGGG
jgi:hypothetical protein